MIDAHSRLFSSTLSLRDFPTKVFRKVTHCIFDMDGTLLDSECTYHQMIHTLCEKYGKNYSKEMEHKLYGGTDRDICLAVVKELKMPISADEMENQLTNISSKMLRNSPLMAGAERLLRHLHDYKIPLALATNSTERSVRLHVASKPAFFSMFHHKVSVTDPGVLRGKPHPDLYLLAASKFQDKPKPAKCLVFEDTERGVLAAREAGMQVVMIPDIKLDREKTRKATLVIRSLLDFKPELFGLPPFDDTKGEKTISPEENKLPDTEVYRTKAFEVKDPKDGLKKNDSMILREQRKISVYEAFVERKSIRISGIHKLLGRTTVQGRTSIDKHPYEIHFIDKPLETKGENKETENKDQRSYRISDQRNSKSYPERLGKKKVSITEGPYERKIITYEPDAVFVNSVAVQHGRKMSIPKESDKKSKRRSVVSKFPKSVEEPRRAVDEQRQLKSKREEKGSK